MKNFNFVLEEKLDEHCDVEFGAESHSDGLITQKPYFDFGLPLLSLCPGTPAISQRAMASWCSLVRPPS
jgi:hypothetical protein